MVKNNENDIELCRKEIQDNYSKPKPELNESLDFNKLMRNKEIFDKQCLEKSYKTGNQSKYTYSERIKELAKTVTKFPTLLLKVLNSNTGLKSETEKNIPIKINAQGLIAEEYERLDGYTYFGNSVNAFSIANKDDVDFNLILKSNSVTPDTKNIGKYFQIEFVIEKEKYFIKDLGNGYGTFVRLDYPLLLKDNHLIHIGESFIVANITKSKEDISKQSFAEEENMWEDTLKLKLFGVANNGETYYFKTSKSTISIGRCSTADIQINDKLLSKFHCSVTYVAKEGWVLFDGLDGKQSTNGTWLYMNEDFEIYDQMVFKSNQNIFQCLFEK